MPHEPENILRRSGAKRPGSSAADVRSHAAFADITDSSLAGRIGRSLEPAWVFLPAGIFFTVASIRALWRGEKPKYTDEDAARAKKALDRMYLKEHGKLPEEDKEENDKKEAP